MHAAEPARDVQTASDKRATNSIDVHSKIFCFEKPAVGLAEQRALITALAGKTDSLRPDKANEHGLNYLAMPSLPGFHPPLDKPFTLQPAQPGESASVLHHYSAPVLEGQGRDLDIKFHGQHPGVMKIELLQPKEPYAAVLSEEVTVTGDDQHIRLHGITGASKDGLLFKMKVESSVGAVSVQGVHLTATQALTAEHAHYSVKNGTVVEDKNRDVLGKNSLGKSVEIRNGAPFIIGFEDQSLNLADHTSGQQNIQKFLIEHATGATNTPYWNQYQKNSQEFVQKANWLEAHGIEVKEHPALWDQLIPTTNSQGKSLVVTPAMIKAHAQEIARLPGQFTEINETADVNSAPDNAVTQWIKKEGPARATEKAIEWAKQADPEKKVLYNDFQNGAQEMHMLDQMQKDGKLPDAIGIQLHMDQGNWPLARVEETINRLSKYGKPIYITEISVLSGANGESMSKVNHDAMVAMTTEFNTERNNTKYPADAKTLDMLCRQAGSLANQTYTGNDIAVVKNMLDEAKLLQDTQLRDKIVSTITKAGTWADTPEGEKIQAEYTENLYKLLHSNPHVQGITWWDMSDKDAWKGAPRGWFREDGSPKLVVDRMAKLFDHWRSTLPKSS